MLEASSASASANHREAERAKNLAILVEQLSRTAQISWKYQGYRHGRVLWHLGFGREKAMQALEPGSPSL